MGNHLDNELAAIQRQTNRLMISFYQDTEKASLEQLLTHPAVNHYVVSSEKVSTETFSSERWIHWNRRHWEQFGVGMLAVRLGLESGKPGFLIGDCGVTLQEIGGVVYYELGYHIHPDFWNQGYATEAAISVAEWFFTTRTSMSPKVELVAWVHDENLAAIRVAEKVGMSPYLRQECPAGKPAKLWRMESGDLKNNKALKSTPASERQHH